MSNTFGTRRVGLPGRWLFSLVAFSLMAMTMNGIFILRFAYAIDIADVPMETWANSPPSNIMIIIDISVSTSWEVLTPEPDGTVKGRCYLFPQKSYLPAHDHCTKRPCSSDNKDRHLWISQWHGYNSLYYDPAKRYEPWPVTEKHRFKPADTNMPFSNPVLKDTKFKLSGVFLTTLSGGETIVVPNAHYYIIDDLNQNGCYETNEPVYLVTWEYHHDTSSATRLAPKVKRRFYHFRDNGNAIVENEELVLLADTDLIDRIKKRCVCSSDNEALQNYANWFSYHRRRLFAIKSAIAKTFLKIEPANVGIYTVEASSRIGVLTISGKNERRHGPDRETHGNDPELKDVYRENREKLMNILYGIESDDDVNPLRTSLDQIGRYFHQSLSSPLGASPYWKKENGGACQRSSVIIVTCSRWNGTFTGIGNIDGNKGWPYSDHWSNTLADIAMYYYDSDLAPGLPDLVPVNVDDDASHQHLNTFSLSFGPKETLRETCIDKNSLQHVPKYGDDSCRNTIKTSQQWPKPVSGSQATIDDIRHAAVNGRGFYCGVQKPKILEDSIEAVFLETNRPGSDTSDSLSLGFMRYKDTYFQTFYNPLDWSGDLVAFSIMDNKKDYSQIGKQIIWRASEDLHPSDGACENRRIVTYGGRWRTPEGIPFRYFYLSDGQKASLGSDLIKNSTKDRSAKRVLEYTRGRAFHDFRKRASLLGDIVHSTPVVAGRTLYIGANDGMVHAFSIDTGSERFAYIPNLAFGTLKELCCKMYHTKHRFLADGPMSVGEVLVGKYKRVNYLTGGLGKGAKGYFCLKTRCRERVKAKDGYGDYEDTYNIDAFGQDAAETDVARMVQWEYPAPNMQDDGSDNDGDSVIDEAGESDPDIGYGYSNAYAVNANAPGGRYRPVVIFGNGYNSDNGSAVLYVLDAKSGRLIRKIDTGACADNGLSTPALIDVNLDRCVDYAFAGDLKGNLWKFDLTNTNPRHWGIAYGHDLNHDGVIDAKQGDSPAALFQAVGQPITGRPDVMKMAHACEPHATGYMVVFGTGKYLGPSDMQQGSVQSIYGLWDYGDDDDDSEYLGHLTDRREGLLSNGLKLFRRRVDMVLGEDSKFVRQISDDLFQYKLVEDSVDEDGTSSNNGSDSQNDNPQGFVGWFLDFPETDIGNSNGGERVTANATIRGGTICIPSFAPNNSPCSSGVSASWLYLLNGCSGRPIRDKNDEKMNVFGYSERLNNHLLIDHKAGNKNRTVIIGSDEKGTIVMKAGGEEKCGKVFWRENIW